MDKKPRYHRTTYLVEGGTINVSQSAEDLGDAIDQEMEFCMDRHSSMTEICIEQKDLI